MTKVVDIAEKRRSSGASADLETFLEGRPLIRQAALARALDVSPAFLSELAAKGEMSVIRRGRMVWIAASEVLRVFGSSDAKSAA